MKLITILACNFKLISKEKMIRLAFISNTWKQLRQLDAIWLSYCFIPWRSGNLIIPSMIEPRQRAHSSPLAAGLASELKIDFHPYGAAQHCRYRQNIPRGLPRGGFNRTPAQL